MIIHVIGVTVALDEGDAAVLPWCLMCVSVVTRAGGLCWGYKRPASPRRPDKGQEGSPRRTH